ncbi:MAG: tRNA uridine-5-carboxymethylaminomethyl(34) synthesis enzyme MnmG, partial [Lachnospiraceae bacterium]|nr:tRNA uridine-5-carboxymethylaminomethyl(34) synthesis enzyme MnmG [Lachnospiraceae bacterium]
IEKKKQIESEIARLKEVIVGAARETHEVLISLGSTPLKTGASLAELICRPELTYESLAPLDPERGTFRQDVIDQINIEIKYEGYIERQKHQVEQFKKIEKKLIPENIDYDDVSSLRLEARQKLKKFKPVSVGQASRISGVSPADVSVLLVYLEHFNARGN